MIQAPRPGNVAARRMQPRCNEPTSHTTVVHRPLVTGGAFALGVSSYFQTAELHSVVMQVARHGCFYSRESYVEVRWPYM